MPVGVSRAFGIAIGRLDTAEPGQVGGINHLVPIIRRIDILGQDLDDLLFRGKQLEFRQTKLLLRESADLFGALLGLAAHPNHLLDALRSRDGRRKCPLL